MRKNIFWSIFILSVMFQGAQARIECAKAPLRTTFAVEIDTKAPLQEYPRPQLVRDSWINLNGEWDYTLEQSGFVPTKNFASQNSYTTAPIPAAWSGKIVVPFAIDAPLSGVGHILRPEERLWYNRLCDIPQSWMGRRIMMRFQASDWETTLYVNGKHVGQHRGGYDPFSFDVTDFVTAGQNKINVAIWDATNSHPQAGGKQTLIAPEQRRDYLYQPTGGIWQTVWLEALPQNSIESIKITPLYDAASVRIEAQTTKPNSKVVAQIKESGKIIATATIPVKGATIPMKGFKSWSPDAPFLYDVEFKIVSGKSVEDRVLSYFGMRKIEVKRGSDSVARIYLNNDEIFMYGPLDQGYWPDGVLTPPSEKAILFDVEYMKKIGCNMARVHVKTHPDRWYYHADRLGLLVWQDSPNVHYSHELDAAARTQWESELRKMIDWQYNHPSIVTWIIFNERWGQYDTERITTWAKSYDPSRLVTGASGYDDFACGDIVDAHDYTFYPKLIPDHKLNRSRAAVIGECAGMNLPVVGHTWYSASNPTTNPKHNNYTPLSDYSFDVEVQRHTYPDSKAFTEGYRRMINTLRWHNAVNGCNAAVYTQMTDIEHELNGWLTYDRKVSKIPIDTMRKINSKLYKRIEVTPLIDWSQVWTTQDGEPTKLPVAQSVEQKRANKPKLSSYNITNYFDIKDVNAEHCVATYGLNNCEIFINDVKFRETAGNFSALRDRSYDAYAICGDDKKILKAGRNKIEVRFKQRADDTYFDVALFEQKL